MYPEYFEARERALLGERFDALFSASEAPARGLTVNRLRCAPENAIAQRFYKKYGFEKVGEEHGPVTLDLLEKYIGYDTKNG